MLLRGQSPMQQVWGMKSLEGLDHELVVTIAWGGVRVQLVEIVGGGTLLDEINRCSVDSYILSVASPLSSLSLFLLLLQLLLLLPPLSLLIPSQLP